MSAPVIGIIFVISMIAIAFMGAVVMVQDNQNMINGNVSGTQTNGTPAGSMIKSTGTYSVDILGILILVALLIAVIIFLFAVYAITR
jgi:hypothetical protein